MKAKLGLSNSTTSRPVNKVNVSLRLRSLTPPYATPPLGLLSISRNVEAYSVTVENYTKARFIDSSDTLGTVVDGTSHGFILWDPVKHQAVRALPEPKLRRYNPPKFRAKVPTLRLPEEPFRRPNTSDSAWLMIMNLFDFQADQARKRHSARIERYRIKRDRHLKRMASYDASYSRSVVRFKRKLNLYLRRLTVFGGPGYKRLKDQKRYTVGSHYSLFEIKAPVEVHGRRIYTLNNLYSDYASYTIWDEANPAPSVPWAFDTPSLIASLQHLSSRNDDTLKLFASRKLSSGKVDGGVVLGEARETAQLLVQIVKFLVHIKYNVVGFSGKVVTLKDVSDIYLSYKFGVAPLIDDMQKFVALLQSEIQTHGTVKVKVGITRSLDREFIPFLNGITVSGRVRIFRTYIYTIENPFYRILETLGLLNLPSIAWELAPLSFVFDWFYNIGGFLEVQTATSGLVAQEAWETLDVQGYGTMGGVAGEVYDASSFISTGALLPTGTSDIHQRTVSFSSGPVRLKYRRRISTDLDISIPTVKLGDWPISKLITSLALGFQRLNKIL